MQGSPVSTCSCHGESGIPESLYPYTKFPSECCTPPYTINYSGSCTQVKWWIKYPAMYIVSLYRPL